MSYESIVEDVKTIPEELLGELSLYIKEVLKPQIKTTFSNVKEMERFRNLRGKIEFSDDYDYKSMRIGV